MKLRLLLALALAAPVAAAQIPASDVDPRHRAYDEMLDLNVRDGLVYYLAVQGQRGGLNRYIASLDVPAAEFTRMPRESQMALLINAYNAIVLQTVVQHYPIVPRVKTFPDKSIRQIPGAYERKHAVAGRSVSLDELERWLLDDYKDARVVFALGRGSIGGGRLKSEAYTGARLDAQLADATREFVLRQGHFRIDRAANSVIVSPLYSWREADLTAGFGDKADAVFANRSALERAILALTIEHLFPSEQAWLRENAFKMTFGDYDWRLNDLTGGRVD
jgi:hypothetical protein